MREQLKETLELYQMNTLREMVNYLRIDPNEIGKRKADLIRSLHKKIQEVAKSQPIIQNLGPAEKAALGWLLEQNGFGYTRELNLALMLAGLIYIEGVEATRDLPRLRDVLLKLMRCGLVVNLSDLDGGSTRRTFSDSSICGLAPEVQPLLPRDLLPAPQAKGLPHLATPPQYIVSGDPEQFVRQLFFVWSEVRNQPVKRLKAGGVGKRDLRRIAQSVQLDVEQDKAILTWLFDVLFALNLLTENHETFNAVDNAASILFWNGRISHQVRDILKQYVTQWWALSLNIGQLRDYHYYSRFEVQPGAEIRTRVVDMIKRTVSTQWIDMALFANLLISNKPGTLTLPDSTRDTLYNNLRWYNARSRTALEQALRDLDMQAICHVLRELQVMGIVNLGYASGRAGNPIAIQITDVGQAYVDDTSLPEETLKGQVILQPDFQILAMGPVPLRVLANLERFSLREKFDESVITYRMTREQAYLAFQRGETSASIQRFLEEYTQQPVPQNVARSLDEWSEQYERIVLRREVTILQVNEKDLLNRLMDDATLGSYIHRLDEHTAWIHKKHVSQVEKQLAALELLPSHSRGPETDLPCSLTWQGERIRSRYPLPSLYVIGNIRRIAEPLGDDWQDGWQLTQASIRAALAAGMTIPDIVAHLEQMTGESLPLKWERQLKAWGKHYGDAAMARVTLLHLEEKAVRELRHADPELHHCLHPMPKAPGLVVIKEEDLDVVRAKLAEWGIVLTETNWW